jgi:hypothetical protein
MADTKVKTANYTAEMVDQIVALYEQLGNDGMEQIAQTVGKPVRSVRSKLVREGVYVASPAKPKAAKVEGPTKKEMLIALEAIAPFPVDGLMGATKEAIADITAFVSAKA